MSKTTTNTASSSKATKAPAAAKAPAVAKFDLNAAQYPYMFIGALASLDDTGRMIQLALGQSVMDPSNVTANEAKMGWGINGDVYYALEDKSAAAVSEAAFKVFKGNAKAFSDACPSPDTWGLWETMGNAANEGGILEILKTLQSAASNRDTRRMIMQNSLYFAGLAKDEPGSNRIALQMLNAKIKQTEVQKFILDGPDAIERMRAESDAIASELASSVVIKEPAKRKRPDAGDSSIRRVRRAQLLMAIVDSGCEAPKSSTDMTEEEQVFIDKGPRKMNDIVEEAASIANRRKIAVRRTAATEAK